MMTRGGVGRYTPPMAPGSTTHKFQAPKGTRDFPPEAMAVRHHLDKVWREVSVNHGFDEIEGPSFEHLELYTLKSGPGIVSELFSFRRAGGETDYALRPEFTPTLARMAASRGRGLAVPTKWFSIPVHYRGERPQRGRLREFRQWNVDVLGVADASADAETIAVAVGVLDRFGLTPADVQVKISHRHAVSNILTHLGVTEAQLPAAFDLLDRRDKLEPEQFTKMAVDLGFDVEAVQRFEQVARTSVPASESIDRLAESIEIPEQDLQELAALREHLGQMGLLEWCRYDLGIVRGLAYYTGTVFEIHDTAGKERAIAGGGRYDNLIELFGGPPTPAVGIAMGDVVIALMLDDRGLLEDVAVPAPDAFVISAGSDEAEALLPGLVMRLRRAGMHVRHSYRSTRNVGKLLSEANKRGARNAVILGEELGDDNVVVKDLASGDQRTVPLSQLEQSL